MTFKRLVCGLLHGRADKAFTLPSPHPTGQKFNVKCRKCGLTYVVITPEGWTSPWGSKSAISHQDREDPVHQHNGSWYFWTVGNTSREGPFSSESEARESHGRYYRELSEKMASDAKKPDVTKRKSPPRRH